MDKLAPEHGGAALVVGESHQGPNDREAALVGAEVALDTPDGDEHGARYAMARSDPGEQFPMVLQQSPALLNPFLEHNPIKVGPEIQPKLRLVSITFDYTFDLRYDPGQRIFDRGFGDASLTRFLPKTREPIGELDFFLRSLDWPAVGSSLPRLRPSLRSIKTS